MEYFGLHDAEVIAVAVDRLSGVARLDVRQEGGVLRSVELHGVKAFRSEDLTLQNVVSRILRSLSSDTQIYEIRRHLPLRVAGSGAFKPSEY